MNQHFRLNLGKNIDEIFLSLPLFLNTLSNQLSVRPTITKSITGQEKKQLTLDKDNENELEGSTKRFVEYAYTVRICYPWKKDNVTVERSRD